MTRTVRHAHFEDIPEILLITNHAIERTHAHFATEPTTLERLERDWTAAAGRYPWLVAAEGPAVLGFAKAGPWKPRGAYRWTTEVGVYVRDSARGAGVGRLLYEHLFTELEHAGFRTVLAGVALPNAASVRLHESLGMQRVGVLPGVGFKLGAWRDVAYYALTFGDSSHAPAREPSVSGSVPPPHQ